METKQTMTLLNKNTQELETFNIHTGEIVARSGQLVASHVYSLEIADAITNLIREGLTLSKTSEALKVPLHLIYYWREMHPDFKAKLIAARKDRGTYFHDKAVDVLEETDTIEKEDVPGAKFKFDSYLKLAGISSPTEFAPQPKQAATQAPATIIINTGITRSPVTIEGEFHDPTTIPPTVTFGEIKDCPDEQAGGVSEERGDNESGDREDREDEAGCEEPSSEGALRGEREEAIIQEESNEEKGE